ncbi:Uncharacterized protein TCM_011225 [Theobroma cacao]|uniref:Reverse transcriptase Ty1/copia-type domain-containing protein n=1 Tax=Theobroma cacao TaxID=3641 RepID=A0A061E9J0_THECC|nr:Uncharacterized protein TCM_011225 [Theobroma cacao]
MFQQKDVIIVEKILRSLTPKYNFIVCSIEKSHDIDELSLDELQSSLLVHEQKLIHPDQVEQDFQVSTQKKGYEVIIKDGTGKTQNDKLGLIAQIWPLEFGGLKILQQKNMVTSLSTFQIPSSICEDYVIGKQHRESFSKGTQRTREILEIVHSNISGPITLTSNGGKRSLKQLQKMKQEGQFRCYAQIGVENMTHKIFQNFWDEGGAKQHITISLNDEEQTNGEGKQHDIKQAKEVEHGSQSTSQKSIGVKWVFKTKLKENGEIDKHKAKLVAERYKQEYGVDYEEVFAPVTRHDTIRMILGFAAQNQWLIYQLDIKSSFLHGKLQEEVYVDQPPGHIRTGEEHKVYRLKKALYGLNKHVELGTTT